MNFSAVQANATQWCIQRGDGYYFCRDGNGSGCWSTSQTVQYYIAGMADKIAWILNHPPATSYETWSRALSPGDGYYISCAVSVPTIAHTIYTFAEFGAGGFYWTQSLPESPHHLCYFTQGTADDIVWMASHAADAGTS